MAGEHVYAVGAPDTARRRSFVASKVDTVSRIEVVCVLPGDTQRLQEYSGEQKKDPISDRHNGQAVRSRIVEHQALSQLQHRAPDCKPVDHGTLSSRSGSLT